MRRRQVLGAIAGAGIAGVASTGPTRIAPVRVGRGQEPSATVRWAETYDRPASWTFEAGVPTDDGGAVVCGWESRTEPFTGQAVLAKIDDGGSIAWETTVSGDAETYALWDVTAIDGGYAAIGGRDVIDRAQTREQEGFADGGLLVTFDEEGTEQWRQVLRRDQWVYSALGAGDRTIIGRGDEFRQFLGPNEQGRSVSIDEEPLDRDNDFVTSLPEAMTMHDDRLYVGCTRNEGFEDDERRIHIPRREPMVLEMTVDPLRILETYRFEMEDYHWVTDIVARDDGIYVSGIRSVRESFIRDPDLEGFLMRIDGDGNQQWYESVADENGLRFTGLATHPAWDALLAVGQTLDRGRAYLTSTGGDSIDQLYEQEDSGFLADVVGTTVGAALLTGATDSQSDDDPFAASIAVDPSGDNVVLESDPTDPGPGDAVTFSVRVDDGWTPTAIEWSGDVSGSGDTVETTFDNSGTYTIEATLTNEVGGQVTVEESVTVGSPGDDGGGGDGGDSIPGFGVPAALVGVAGSLGALYGRRRLGGDSDGGTTDSD